MSKKTIVILSLAVFLAGVLILKEFVFSTTISKERAAQMTTLPEPRPEKDSEKIKLNSKGAVTFLLSANDIIYYYAGEFNGVIIKTGFDEVGQLIKKYNADINSKDLMFIIKTDKAATFKNAIDILDQMTLNNVPAGHYAEIEITEKEIESINNFKEMK